MKLIGSKMENDFRNELIKSHHHHFSANSNSKLKILLEEHGYPIERAFILDWTPDQQLCLVNGHESGPILVDLFLSVTHMRSSFSWLLPTFQAAE